MIIQYYTSNITLITKWC